VNTTQDALAILSDFAFGGAAQLALVKLGAQAVANRVEAALPSVPGSGVKQKRTQLCSIKEVVHMVFICSEGSFLYYDRDSTSAAGELVLLISGSDRAFSLAQVGITTHALHALLFSCSPRSRALMFSISPCSHVLMISCSHALMFSTLSVFSMEAADPPRGPRYVGKQSFARLVWPLSGWADERCRGCVRAWQGVRGLRAVAFGPHGPRRTAPFT
jgi:hypothetical protein